MTEQQPVIQPVIRYDRDDDGVVTITLDDPASSVNTMNDAYLASMAAALERLDANAGEDLAGVAGVVIASAKKSFVAGADLPLILGARRADAERIYVLVEGMKAQLRRLERYGRPVVAALNGSALGGGLEVALACHHRIAVDDDRIEFGFPEVTLGVLPGGGGVTRVVRMLGLQPALTDWLLQGQRYSPAQAKERGLVDELVATREALLPAAKAWILAHRDDADARTKPWDRKGFKIPGFNGGAPADPPVAAMLPALPAMLRKQLKGAPYPAPRAILCAAVEGAQVDFDTASRIETRYFADLASGPISTNMVQAFFVDLQTAAAPRKDRDDVPAVGTVGVLGAGMMGAGIAHACARAGMTVLLKDVSVEAAERGKAHCGELLSKQVAKGRLTGHQFDELMGRITPTDQAADLAGCDVIIEAVFEDAALKHRVFAEVEAVVGPDTLLCSNTSTLPITDLAAGVTRPADFIGLHFFSPVDKMRLVEIIRAEQTSPRTLARALDLVRAIRKLPIVVNDGPGFYTSRGYGALITEGAAMVGEGIDPASIERAATSAGFPAPPLAMMDEVSLTLLQHIRDANADRDTGLGKGGFVNPAGMAVVDRMVNEFGRKGRAAGGGFYDYPEQGPKRFWPGLREHFGGRGGRLDGPREASPGGVPAPGRAPLEADPNPAPIEDLRDRLLFAMALETARCFEQGVLVDAASANIGAIFGIGFPGWTGGTAQFITNYTPGAAGGAATGDPTGPPGFVARADELAQRYGDRFAPSPWLRELAAAGNGFGAG